MENETPKEVSESRPSRHDGVVAHWPRLVFVVLALIGLLLMSSQGRAKLSAVVRALTPGLSSGDDSTKAAVDPVLTGEAKQYQERFQAEREIRKALHERLYSRKYDAYTMVDAEVMKRDPFEGYYTGDLFLNQGSKSNVRVGMVVVNRDRMVVGRIVAVDKLTSTLRLITHPDLSLSIRVPARDLCGITSAAKGMVAAGKPAMLFPLPSLFVSAIQAEEAEGTGRRRDQREPRYLRPGDFVVTNGASDPANFADGLLVGQVSHSVPVETDTSGWPLRACLIPGRLDSLRFVKIVIPPPLPAGVPADHSTTAAN